jgi:hypothetical protein
MSVQNHRIITVGMPKNPDKFHCHISAGQDDDHLEYQEKNVTIRIGRHVFDALRETMDWMEGKSQ